MKNRLIVLLLILIVMGGVLGNKEIYAESVKKSETVYGLMNSKGEIKNIYIVNEFKYINEKPILDYGNYTEIKKLSFEGQIETNIDSNEIKTEEDLFYYQGENELKNLPWVIDIEYFLNDEEIMPSDLAGKSGYLDIDLSINKNNIIEEDYFDKYLLQISISFDSENTNNLVAEGSTIAIAGSNRIITYTSIPGEQLNCRISANVNDFEMDGISINAVPINIDKSLLGIDDFKRGLNDLSSGIEELNEGSKELLMGSVEIQKGLEDLKFGSNNYMEGLVQINNSGYTITSGSNQILAGLNELNTQLSSYSNDDLINGLIAIKDNLTLLSDSLVTIKNGLVTANNSMGNAIATIPSETISEADLNLIVSNNLGDDNVLLLIQYYRAALTIKGTYEVVNANNTELFAGIDNITLGIEEIITNLELIIAGAENSGMDELITAVNDLYDDYYIFNLGLNEYTLGINDAVNGYDSMNEGIEDLESNYRLFNDGVKDLNSGILELNEGTKDIPDELDELTDLLDNSDYKPVSFASAQNGEIAYLQFVLKTEAIKKDEAVIEKPEDDEKLNFWQRLIRLFIKD